MPRPVRRGQDEQMRRRTACYRPQGPSARWDARRTGAPHSDRPIDRRSRRHAGVELTCRAPAGPPGRCCRPASLISPARHCWVRRLRSAAAVFWPARRAAIASRWRSIVVISWLVGLQIGLVILTVASAGFFSSNRADTLALRVPRGGWRVLPLALLLLFAFTGMWRCFSVVASGDLICRSCARSRPHDPAAALAAMVLGHRRRCAVFGRAAVPRLPVLRPGQVATGLWPAAAF